VSLGLKEGTIYNPDSTKTTGGKNRRPNNIIFWEEQPGLLKACPGGKLSLSFLKKGFLLIGSSWGGL